MNLSKQCLDKELYFRVYEEIYNEFIKAMRR